MTQPHILYGVQGTGNGHLSRARLMAEQFQRLDVKVDFVFSGRHDHSYFAMEDFQNTQYKTGLTFATANGRISRRKTLIKNRPLRYLCDVLSLPTQQYDLVITDFEPTVAWAARFRRTPSLALGHQYALCGSAPRPQGDLFAKWLIQHFAPASQQVGMHWHRYHPETLPPMVDTTLARNFIEQEYTLVYLPFENLNETVTLLQQLKREHFVLYSPNVKLETQHRNVSIYPLSKSRFRHHLQCCSRVICNTGFELITEAMHLGLPVLTKPLQGQYEQMSNAMALKELQLATVVHSIGVLTIDKFMCQEQQLPGQHYPDVASALAYYCVQQLDAAITHDQAKERRIKLSEQLWSRQNLNQRVTLSKSHPVQSLKKAAA